MKRKLIRLITAVFVILAIIPTLASCTVLTEADSVELALTKKTNLFISFPSVDLTVRVAKKKETPHIEYSLSYRSLSKSASEMILKVESSDNNTYISTKEIVNLTSCKVELVLPKEGVSTLNLELTSGSGTVSDISAKSININSSSGSFEFSDVTAKTMQIDVTSGQLDIDCSVSDTVWVDITSGSVDISNSKVPDSFKCNTTSGNVTLRIPDGGFFLKYEKTTGSITSDFIDTSEISGSSGTADYDDGHSEFEVNVTSGSVRILKLS